MSTPSESSRNVPPRRPRPPRTGDRLRRIWHDHGLSISLVALFLVSMVGQTWAGWRVYNEERDAHREPPVTLGAYLTTGHFGEATFENWESEFLQMTCFVLLTVFLYQRGSSESKRPDVLELVDLDPRDSLKKDAAPWPVRRGGVVLVLYQNSLSIAFAALFVASLVLHAATGVVQYNRISLRTANRPCRPGSSRSPRSSGSNRSRTGRANSCRWRGWWC